MDYFTQVIVGYALGAGLTYSIYLVIDAWWYAAMMRDAQKYLIVGIEALEARYDREQG
jgi:hypothetical protein